MTTFPTGRRHITRDGRPYLIAEVGVNHENDMATAEEMIGTAARAGADAVKFQWYKANQIASTYALAYWDTDKLAVHDQRSLFARYDQWGLDEYRHLADVCARVGVDFLCTPFHPDQVEGLQHLVPFYKVASADLTNTVLLDAIHATGKPILMSTGASTMNEIAEAVARIHDRDVALLHCVLEYPTPLGHANTKAITSLRSFFPRRVVGWSDHVAPLHGQMPAMQAAYLAGARIFEKHYTLDRSQPNNDHHHSMEPDDLARFARWLDQMAVAAGDGSLRAQYEETARREARRSLVAARNISKGTRLTSEDLAVQRPGWGLPPSDMDAVVGRVADVWINIGQPITSDLLTDAVPVTP